jgi:acetyl-CoA acetyltransferase family protein
MTHRPLTLRDTLGLNHPVSETLVFLSGKRTPFGSYGGSLKDVNPSALGAAAGRAALAEAGVRPEEIDHVVFGNVLHSAADSIYTPRHIGLELGIPEATPALGINRLCGSGFQVVIEAYHQMLAGDTKLALVGGVENMSLTPYVLRSARWGARMGHAPVEDMMMQSLTDTRVGAPMAITAENLAERHSLGRAEVDAFALESQRRYEAARAAGKFRDEIAPFVIEGKKGPTTLDRDEHPKPDATAEGLAKLKAVFKAGGVVTAGNASGIVDGAAALVVATESEAKRRNARPLGRMVSYGIVGCDPRIMGIGPVPAARQALARAGMKLDQMDLVEINEAFAPQALAVIRELETDSARVNVNGGAIAVGHPLAASGTRILHSLLLELRRRGQRYGLGSACIGGGQGIAILVEAYPGDSK